MVALYLTWGPLYEIIDLGIISNKHVFVSVEFGLLYVARMSYLPCVPYPREVAALTLSKLNT